MTIKTITVSREMANQIKEQNNNHIRVGDVLVKRENLTQAEKRNRYLTGGRGRGLASISEIISKG